MTALERIKRYDRDCGGYSDFVVLTDKGEIAEHSRFDIEKGEEFSQFFYEMVNLIYEDIAKRPYDPPDDATRRRMVDDIMDTIIKRRVELERGKTRLEELLYLLKQSDVQKSKGQQ